MIERRKTERRKSKRTIIRYGYLCHRITIRSSRIEFEFPAPDRRKEAPLQAKLYVAMEALKREESANGRDALKTIREMP
jgi:hypothetical protein